MAGEPRCQPLRKFAATVGLIPTVVVGVGKKGQRGVRSVGVQGGMHGAAFVCWNGAVFLSMKEAGALASEADGQHCDLGFLGCVGG